MMVEIEDINGDRKIIGIGHIISIEKDKERVSEIDEEPLAVLILAGSGKDIILKHSFDAFKRAVEGGGAKIIRG